MAYSSGKISAPVSIYDIQQALGVSETDLGSLCKHANINMWAKYKPVIRASVIDTTGQLKSDKTWKPINDYGGTPGIGSVAWYRSDAGNFGITPKAFSIGSGDSRTINALNNLAAVVKASTDGLNGWIYTRPNGTISEPFRQIDFNRYYDTAPRPVVRASISANNIYASDTGGWQISLDIMGSAYNDVNDNIDARDYLRLGDVMTNNYHCYLGIAIFKKDSNNNYQAMAWCTGNIWYGVGVQTSGSDGAVSIGTNNVEARFLSGHTYYVLPVLFAEQLPQTDGQGNTLYGYSKQTRLTSGNNDKMWSIPNTTFIPFTTTWIQRNYNWALPRVNPMEIGVSSGSGYYNGVVVLDSTPAGYTGSGSQQITAEYALVTEEWRGDLSNMSSDEYVAGSHGTWTNTIPANAVTQIANFSGTHALIGLSTTQMYRWVIDLGGEKTIITLRQPYIPST
jgi:hypothetical protein